MGTAAAAAAAIVSRRVPLALSPCSILLLSIPRPPHRHSTLLLPLSSPAFLKPTLTCARRRTPLGALHLCGALLQDAGATAVVMAGGYLLVRAFDVLTDRNIIEQLQFGNVKMMITTMMVMMQRPETEQEAGAYIVRTFIHGFLASLQDSVIWTFLRNGAFVAVPSYHLFGLLNLGTHLSTLKYGIQIITSTEARYFAAVVPLVNCLQLLIYGLSIASDKGLVKSLTRDGKPDELIRGPLYYVLVLMLCALVFWRVSPAGVIPLSMMSGGDGFADIMGRRFGVLKLPYNQDKSWVGSICMCLFGFVMSIGMLYYFESLGYMQLDWVSTVKKVAVISLAAALVESLPISQFVDDNLSVPLMSMMMATLFFSPGPSL